MEWLVLLLVVPAILVPIVLLYGFAGCKFEPRQAVGSPVVTATAKNVDHITVSWQNTETEFTVTGYVFVRKRGTETQRSEEVAASVTSVEDTRLDADTDYAYEVSAITTGGPRARERPWRPLSRRSWRPALLWLPRSFAPGTYALGVLAWYGLGRFWLEPLREAPDLVSGRLRIDQVVAGLLAVAAGCGLLLLA